MLQDLPVLRGSFLFSRKLDLRPCFWSPGIGPVIRLHYSPRCLPTHRTESFNIEPHVVWSKGLDIGGAKVQQAGGRTKPFPILGMLRAKKLLAHVDKCTGDLDETFVEDRPGVRAFQPKMFEDIMRLVVIAPVEKGKKTLVTNGILPRCFS